MGSKAAEVWKFVEPVIPCVRRHHYYYYYYSGYGRKRDCGKSVDIGTVREEIAAVGARVNNIDEQIENIKAALPELDSKIRYAIVGMPVSSLSLDDVQHLKRIHFQLLRFWEESSRKQLEKLSFLSDCLQVLEEQRPGGKNNNKGEELSKTEEYKVSEKVESDLRKNQELEMKLYLDRISSVPDTSKTTPLPVQYTPERGPQRVASEQIGKKNRSEHKVVLSEIEKRISDNKLGTSTLSTPAERFKDCASTPSPPAQRCKESGASTPTPSTPGVLPPVPLPGNVTV